MTKKADITIDLNKTCTRCGAKGVTESGLCLKCVGIIAMDSIDDIRKQVKDRVDQEAQQFPAKDQEDQKITSKFIRECLNKNELGDAMLYASLFRDRFLYCKNKKAWFEWTGNFWQLDVMDNSLAAVEKVALLYIGEYKKISAEIADQVSKGIDPASKEIKKLENKTEALLRRVSGLRAAGKRRSACRDMAHTMDDPMAIAGEEFDQKPMLFPCANGVVDLETGKLKPGRPEDYLSMVSPIEFKGIDEPAPLWEKSLLEIFSGNEEMVSYLQRLLGYGITGLVDEKVFPVLYGRTGWNGRSFIIETISHVMGALAGSIPSEMLLSSKMARSSSGPSPDIMSLKGIRLAFASEIDENQRFSTAKIKWLTGKDELTGRNPHDTYSTRFKPTHKLMVMTNTQPEAPPNDRAFWERLHLINFKISFVKREPQEAHERRAILDLDKQILKEASGILSFLIRGCLLWQKYGLAPPREITDATEEYRRNEDLLADFIEECLIVEPGAKERASKLYGRFVQWWHDNIGKKERSGTWFGKLLSQKFEKNKSEGCVMYHGIRLLDVQGDMETSI